MISVRDTLRNILLASVCSVALGIGISPAKADQSPDFTAAQPPQHAIWLESLDVSKISQEYGTPAACKSVDGHPLKIGGVLYPHGIGTHANSEWYINLNGAATRFESIVGVDDETDRRGSITYEVWVDGKRAAETKVLRGGESQLISVDLTGAKKLVLVVTYGGDDNQWDHADWAGAMLFLAPGSKLKPESTIKPIEPTLPIVHIVPSKIPAIHGARIVGSTPGKPFFFCIPATGKGPLTYSAENLPEGLQLDSKTGIITGSLKNAGETIATITVTGPCGSATRKLKIVGGIHVLAETPPMGWNSWNVWAGVVSAQRIRESADAMVEKGLRDHGFQYVNIDDCWQAGRDASGEIVALPKFGDMKLLSDYVHSKGLKVGLYSSPGPKTCAGFEGSYQHEQQDADTYAKWGFDYLKYDWCSYGSVPHENTLAGYIKPYQIMGDALDRCSRDILYSLCQYGMMDVGEWGAKVGGACWRTGGDITDSWSSLQGIIRSQNGREKYAGPGHWNDPDMLIVGKLGWGRTPRPSRLLPNEQIMHMTAWSLLAAPLLIGCDMSQLDSFTLDLLTNDEVLDVNQDPLGVQGSVCSKEYAAEVMARPLWDGTIAVGLLNLGTERTTVTAKWSDLGIQGSQKVRDLWQQKTLGVYKDSFSAEVPSHGAILLKIGMPNRVDW